MGVSYGMVLGKGTQTGAEASFVGGRPKLPPGIPVPACKLCGTQQTFFFQVVFPADHPWAGSALAVFSCTACADEDHLIPEMLPGLLSGADVPSTFLTHYQQNFRLLVFEPGTATVVTGYTERVRFQSIQLKPRGMSSFGVIGGSPAWVLENEAPATIHSVPAAFLLQLHAGFRFETLSGAPRQMSIALDGTPTPSPDADYQLFIGNEAYLFGPSTTAGDMVYILTQVDQPRVISVMSRRIYGADGLYSAEVRRSLLEVIRRNREAWPEVFAKQERAYVFESP